MAVEKLIAYADKLLKDLANEAREYTKSILPNKNLYHYTSFNNFVRIIENNELCFTDYRHLNDPTEILLFEKVLREAIENKYKQSPFGESFWKLFLELFSALITEESFKKVSHYLTHLEKFESIFYTFSFCAEADYLPMWRYYAGNGTGISLGFRPEFFVSEEPKDIHDKKPRSIYTDIIYEKEKFLSVINNLLNLAETQINCLVDHCKANGISEKDSKEIGNKFLHDLRVHLSTILLPLMAGFKHHGYKDEKEHRLYYLECTNTYKPEYNKKPAHYPFDPIPQNRKGTKTRKVLEGICLPDMDTKVPLVKSDKFSLDNIAEIWVGPCVHFECAREQIIKLLSAQGYNMNKIDTNEGIKIKKSEMPYR